MAAGKSKVGQALAASAGRRFVDSDRQLEDETGMTAAQIARRDGIDALHERERHLLLEALRAAEPSVIAAASSTIEFADCRTALASAFVVWMRADADVLAQRVRAESYRPLDDDVAAQLREQAARRDPLFASVADVTIDANSFDPNEVAARIVLS